MYICFLQIINLYCLYSDFGKSQCILLAGLSTNASCQCVVGQWYFCFVFFSFILAKMICINAIFLIDIFIFDFIVIKIIAMCWLVHLIWYFTYYFWLSLRLFSFDKVLSNLIFSLEFWFLLFYFSIVKIIYKNDESHFFK